MKAGHYRWVRHGMEKLYEVGILEDGTLYNPNHYPDELVREAVLAADGRRHERRSNGAKKGARTRAKRIERRTYQAAQRILAGGNYGPRKACCICGKGLSDKDSIARGIGSECWQDVLRRITAFRATQLITNLQPEIAISKEERQAQTGFPFGNDRGRP